MSIYETSEKEDYYSRFSTNYSLPTVFSPTPSSQTMFSPSSVDEDIVGKGYLEVYPIQKEFIFGEKPKYGSSLKFNRNTTKLVPSASGESFGAFNSGDRSRMHTPAGHLDSVFFDDDAETCSVITMHPAYGQAPLLGNARQTLATNVAGYPYQLAPSTGQLPLSIKNQQTVDFDLSKQAPGQQLGSTIKFGKNSFSYIDQNDDGECKDE